MGLSFTLLTFSLSLNEVLISRNEYHCPSVGLESSFAFAFEIFKSSGIFRWECEKLHVSDCVQFGP